MVNDKSTFFITTPIYYANSLPHLGHLYTTTVADVVSRYKKQRGFETYFLTGTDEHGINIQRAADKNGRTPQEQVDFIADRLKEMFAEFELDEAHGGYDIFMRTTNPFHYEGARTFWREMAKNKTPKGNSTIYKGFYKAWFCAACAEFKSESEYEVIDGEDVPRCLEHGQPLDRVEEESYFFRLSDYGQILLEKIEANPGLVRPESRRNEIVSFIKGGLQDLSISRERSAVGWGVPVPDDESHVMYVWVDALSNYITAIGYGNNERSNFDFENYWQNAHHFIGKDILRFHTVYWFSFLIAAGLDLPKCVFAHGMWLDAAGRKMSKTAGNGIDPHIVRAHFPIDTVRYFLLREMTFGNDGKFGYENLIERVNAELAKGLGNLSSRTFTMIEKYRGGLIPAGTIHEPNFIYAKRAGLEPDEEQIASVVELARDEYLRKFDDFDFSGAIDELWKVIARVDKMITGSAPWILIKDENQAETLNAVLYRSAEVLRWLSVLLYPVMPNAAGEIYRQTGLKEDISKIDPKSLKWGELPAGTSISEIKAVFPQIIKEKVMNEINSGRPGDGGAEPLPIEAAKASDKPSIDDGFISIEDFTKVELRVGEILVAEKVPDADKLLRFEIDLGEDKPRQILAGLAEYYDPAHLIGRKVVVVANLKPRMMRGLESQGMICAASLGKNDVPAIATFLEEVKNGARLR